LGNPELSGNSRRRDASIERGAKLIGGASGNGMIAPRTERRGSFQGYFGRASEEVARQLMTQLRHGRLKTFAAQKDCSFLR
jgi:hypothetical protein